MQITFVLGVHRSGTSLLTAGLQAAGCDLGTFENRMNDDNPKGEFERRDIVGFNERLLRHLGVSWDNWGFSADSEDFRDPAFAPWRAEAADLLRAAFPAPPARACAIKDPRIAGLLPFWTAVAEDLGWTQRHLLVLRPPREVAESQRQRALRRPGGFPVIADIESMCALWAVTMRTTLSALPGETLVIRHAALYEQPEAVLGQSAAHLGLAVDPAGIARFAADHLDRGLRRVAGDTDDAAPAPGFWQDCAERLHAACDPGAATGLLSPETARAAAGAAPALDAALPALPAVRHSLGRLRERHGTLAAKAAKNRREDLDATLTALSASLLAEGPARTEQLRALRDRLNRTQRIPPDPVLLEVKADLDRALAAALEEAATAPPRKAPSRLSRLRAALTGRGAG